MVEQVQVLAYDSQEYDCYLEGAGFNPIDNTMSISICFDGVVIAAQCTVTSLKICCAPPNSGITRT